MSHAKTKNPSVDHRWIHRGSKTKRVSQAQATLKSCLFHKNPCKLHPNSSPCHKPNHSTAPAAMNSSWMHSKLLTTSYCSTMMVEIWKTRRNLFRVWGAKTGRAQHIVPEKEKITNHKSTSTFDTSTWTSEPEHDLHSPRNQSSLGIHNQNYIFVPIHIQKKTSYISTTFFLCYCVVCCLLLIWHKKTYSPIRMYRRRKNAWLNVCTEKKNLQFFSWILAVVDNRGEWTRFLILEQSLSSPPADRSLSPSRQLAWRPPHQR